MIEGNDWKARVEELRERAQTSVDRASMAMTADECDAQIAALERTRGDLARLVAQIDLAQAQLRAETMGLRERLKGQPKANGAGTRQELP